MSGEQEKPPEQKSQKPGSQLRSLQMILKCTRLRAIPRSNLCCIIALFLKTETPSPARLSQTAQMCAPNLAAFAKTTDDFRSARRPVGMILDGSKLTRPAQKSKQRTLEPWQSRRQRNFRTMQREGFA